MLFCFPHSSTLRPSHSRRSPDPTVLRSWAARVRPCAAVTEAKPYHQRTFQRHCGHRARCLRFRSGVRFQTWVYSSFPTNDKCYTIPDNAFVAPPQYEGTILLETAIDNSAVVSHEDLTNAWAELSTFSVEAALAGRSDVFDFANNHCLLFAAIRCPIELPIPPELFPTDADFYKCVQDLALPSHHTVSYADSPVIPADPDA
ncbi:hypothetical protein C8Q80DRAFT_1228894, partial [Daedaleopsis nitida]